MVGRVARPHVHVSEGGCVLRYRLRVRMDRTQAVSIPTYGSTMTKTVIFIYFFFFSNQNLINWQTETLYKTEKENEREIK